MASIIVDGLPIPIAVGGSPVVDFCNTRAGWAQAEPKEYLRSYRHLAVWAREAGLLTRATAERLIRSAQRRPVEAEATLRAAIEFRDALYPALTGSATPTQWRRVDAEAAVAAGHARLRRANIGEGVASPSIADWGPAGGDLGLPLWLVAWGAGQLLTTIPAGAVRACPGAGCGWLFLDPRGRRRWCSMAWCGNRSKVRRHAARRSAAALALPG